MVSIRCKMMVKEELKKLGLHYVTVNLGEVEIMEDISMEVREQIKIALLRSGLELMDDKKAMLIEKIKNVIIEMVHYSDGLPDTNFSDYLSQKLNYDYTYLANLFSETEATTIEHFIILHKIEKVKELIIYDELNLTEIAWKLHYSSVAHLSTQFKKLLALPRHISNNSKISDARTWKMCESCNLSQMLYNNYRLHSTHLCAMNKIEKRLLSFGNKELQIRGNILLSRLLNIYVVQNVILNEA